MTFKNWAEQSKLGYGTDVPDENGLTVDLINAGSLQRIAAATEKMAVRHTELMAERDRLRASLDNWKQAHSALERSNQSLRGQITKLRKALAAAKATHQDTHHE